jgi:hypothetical protein
MARRKKARVDGGAGSGIRHGRGEATIGSSFLTPEQQQETERRAEERRKAALEDQAAREREKAELEELRKRLRKPVVTPPRTEGAPRTWTQDARLAQSPKFNAWLLRLRSNQARYDDALLAMDTLTVDTPGREDLTPGAPVFLWNDDGPRIVARGAVE